MTGAYVKSAMFGHVAIGKSEQVRFISPLGDFLNIQLFKTLQVPYRSVSLLQNEYNRVSNLVMSLLSVILTKNNSKAKPICGVMSPN